MLGFSLANLIMKSFFWVSIVGSRDRRGNPVDPRTGQIGSIPRYKRRTIGDVPLAGYAREVEIESPETQAQLLQWLDLWSWLRRIPWDTL
jgi:hypothetical protein